MSADSFPPLLDAWYLTGPTASGKTAVGIELARTIDAEIVSLDSMAVYRRLDIGTAKPTADQRAAASHHLIDLISPDQEFSLAEYLSAAHAAAADIKSRGKVVLFVGGTPLYLKSLLRGLFVGPAADWDFRRRLQEQAADRGKAYLHEQLRVVDPVAAEKLHPQDERRIVRALEVFSKTGQPISEHQRQFDRATDAAGCRVFVLNWPREVLETRIAARVAEMFSQGLVEEVRAILTTGGSLSRTARQGVGYREVLEYLAGDATAASLLATIDKVKLHTRQLAKRQLTWFRSLSECRWIDVSPTELPAETAARIVALATPPRVAESS